MAPFLPLTYIQYFEEMYTPLPNFLYTILCTHLSKALVKCHLENINYDFILSSETNELDFYSNNMIRLMKKAFWVRVWNVFVF